MARCRYFDMPVNTYETLFLLDATKSDELYLLHQSPSTAGGVNYWRSLQAFLSTTVTTPLG